jgi:hypothetical protein
MEVHYQLYKREIVEDWCCIFTKLVFMLKQKANVESIVGNESLKAHGGEIKVESTEGEEQNLQLNYAMRHLRKTADTGCIKNKSYYIGTIE